MRIYLDENGKCIDYLEVRNSEIKEKLEQVLTEFMIEKREMLKVKKPLNLGYRFTKQLYSVLATYPKMKSEDFVMLDYEDVNNYWLKYLDLTAYYNRFFEIVDNKQLLMAFMGINSRQYKELENHENEDIKNLMGMINNAFIGLGFIAGESGNANDKAIMGRLQTRNEGHGLIKESDGKLVDAVVKRSPEEAMRELLNVVGDIKQIGR